MAEIKPVLPSIIGRPQTARNTTRPVAYPNALAGLGEGILLLGAGASGVVDHLTALDEERQRAAYRSAMNDAVAEADKRMNDEVLGAQGFGAEGSLERASKIYTEVGDKYAPKLSGRYAEAFRSEWASRRNSQVNSVMSFERRELTGARASANQSLVKAEVQNYAATAEPAALDRARAAYDDNVRLMNGRLINRASVAKFDEDLKDGDNTLKLPDGRTVRIVDEAKPGETDVITRERINALRSNMEKQADAYEAGLQSMYDLGHAQIVDRYLAADRLTDVKSYLDSVSAEGYPQPISKAALTASREALARKQENADISFQTSKAISSIQASAGPQSQRYGSPEQDRLFTESVRRISDQYAGEKWKTGQKIVSSLESQYRILANQQKAALTGDTVSTLTVMQKKGMNIAQEGQFINGMADSALKSALQKAHDRRAESYNSQTDPLFVAKQESQLNAFKLALANGSAELDGVRYDLQDQEQLKAYVLNLGFTDKNQKRAGEYINMAGKRVDAMQAARTLAELTDADTPMAALDQYPAILAELDARKGTSVIEPKDMPAWLKANIADLLQQKVQNYNSWWFDRGYSVEGAFKGGIPQEDLYQSKEQLTESWRAFNASRAIQRGDTEAARSAMAAKPTEDDLQGFARTRGYRYENGRYFLRGGK